jgi:GntR family transcriptional regulator
MRLPAIFGARHFGDYAVMAQLGTLVDECRLQGEPKLPTESELCRRLSVDRYHLHRLLQTLSRDGLVYQVRGKGWYLQAEKLEIPVARHNSYTANMKQQNRVPRSEILGVDQVCAGEGEFWSLKDPWLWVIDFRRYVGPLAFSLARVSLPVDLTPGLNRHLGPDVSLYTVLQAQYGILPDRRRTWCEAVAADTIVADALAVPLGCPLLRVTHEALWQGQPFEQTVNYLRADAARVRFDLVNPTEEPR